MKTILDAARSYRDRGFRIINVARDEKRPLGSDWGNRVFADEDLPGSFTNSHNIGLICGAVSGNLVDVDCDSVETLALAAEWLPTTDMISGRKSNPSSHYWYRLHEAMGSQKFTDPLAAFENRDKEKRNKTKAMLIEFRCGTVDDKGANAESAQTLVPPSRHPSGESYQWYSDGEPANVGGEALLRTVGKIAAAALFIRYFPASGRHDFCRALSGYLVRGGFSDDDAHDFVFRIAEAADSDDPETRADTAIGLEAKLAAGDHVPGLPSLIKLLGGPGQLLMDAADDWLGFAAKREAKRRETLEKYAAQEGCSIDELEKRWVIKHDKRFYLHQPEGGYRTPGLDYSDVELYLKRFLDHAPIEWTMVDKKGEVKAKPIKAVLSECSSPARHCRASLFAERSYYDAKSDTFIERVAPFRALQPSHNADVEAWLHHLGGSNLDRLLDWLATARELDRQTTVLLLTGAKGAGKGLLAKGLARLWHEAAPTALDKVLGARFNGGMAACPLLFGDEELTSANLRGDAAAGVRALVGADSFTIEKKGQEVSQLEGAPRIVIAANNSDSILRVFSSEHSEEEDRQAVKDRILHVLIGQKAANFLEERGGHDFTRDWVDGDVIARHVLWLEANRKVQRGHRFLVSGNIGSREAMALFNEKTARCLEFLCRYLSEKHGGVAVTIAGIEAGDDDLLVQASAIADNWRRYFATDQQPSSKALGKALANISIRDKEGAEPPRMGVGRVRCQRIDIPKLIEWSEANGIGDRKEIESRVKRKKLANVA